MPIIEEISPRATISPHTLPQQLNGIFVLDKPSGPSSAQCLNAFKKLGQKKIGHAGTLDPMASGVLLVLLGHATKIAGYLQNGDRKIYSGVIRLGVETDTWDTRGRITRESGWDHVMPGDIAAAIAAWTDISEQDVPPYSAAKHKGQPLYKLARRGMDTPHKTKTVKIFKADMLAVSMPLVRFRVICGSGSYVRSLAHSLGKRIGCGAALQELVREYSHPFALEAASPLADLSPEILERNLLPLERGLPDWIRVPLSPELAADVCNGKPVPALGTAARGDHAILMAAGKALALARFVWSERGATWAIIRGLW